MISPSKIALHAAGFPQVIEYKLEEEAPCVMCGVSMQAGDSAAAWNPKDSFTNYTQLQAPHSSHVCPDCAGAWRSEFTQGWATGALFNADGVHKANSVETMAHVLLNPIKTPLLWVKGDQKQQHLVWRTPVTTDANLMRVRLGEKVVAIRRLTVLHALTLVREAEVALKNLPKELRLAKRANPGNEAGIFKYLDWGIDNVDHSILSDGFKSLTTGNEHAEQFYALERLLQSLNFGEVWALMILLKSKNPIAPEIIATPTTTN